MAKFKLSELNPFRNLTIGKVFVFVIALFIIVQVLSLFISDIFKDIPVLKTGSLIIILSVGLTLIFLTKLVFRGEFRTIDFLSLILLGGITVFMYIYGSSFFPEIFSIFGDSAADSAESLASVLNLP